MDVGDDVTLRLTNKDLLPTQTWSQSLNKFESAEQNFLMFSLFHSEWKVKSAQQNWDIEFNLKIFVSI